MKPLFPEKSPADSTPNDLDVQPGPDQEDLDRLFALRANSAWGIAFVTTESVSASTDAVADGFSTLFSAIEREPETESHFGIIDTTRQAAVRIMQSGQESGGLHAREPVSLLGETKDRQSTLALTALAEPFRSALWLSDGERLTIPQIAEVLRTSEDSLPETVAEARLLFRKYYIDATDRSRLDANCAKYVDQLPAYIEHSGVDDVVGANIAGHLDTCDACRGLAARLRDLESRLHAAIPPLPAWTRQYVMDTWNTRGPAVAVVTATTPPTRQRPAWWTTLATAAATIALVGASVYFIAGRSDDKPSNEESTSSQLAAPKITTSATPRSDASVETPRFSPTDSVPTPSTQPAETTATTATTQTVPSTTPVNNATRPSTAGTSTPTTRPRATTTTPPTTISNTLIDLPGTPAPTTPTTARPSNSGPGSAAAVPGDATSTD